QEDLLRSWIDRQIPNHQRAWFSDRLEECRQDPSMRSIDILLGLIPRRLGRHDLGLSENDLEAAEQVRPGLDPSEGRLDQAALSLVLLAAGKRSTSFAALFGRLCRGAEVSEAIALYLGLPLYPEQQSLERQAAEGLRGNMRPVFEAVA